ncbi:MAG: MBL fold metallo-hydrolase [Anaerolineae bacterium]|nr:MBL fold metallo-hydrolase [Anaerolineae bacterium]
MLVALVWLCACQTLTAATSAPATSSRAETVTGAAVTPTLATPEQARVAETPAPSPEPMVIEPTALPEPGGTVTITILYDNNPYAPGLKTSWGFACLVETGEATVLFDTGGDAPLLLANMAALGIDPLSIEIIVLSHIHGDHTGGLKGLLEMGVQPTVYLPRSFPDDFKAQAQAAGATAVEADGPLEIMPGLWSTGEMGDGIREQALVVRTVPGLVVITGCAHPGVEKMVAQAKEVGQGKITLVMGGFHLGDASRGRIEGIIADFRRLGVQKVAPCHCTGKRAMEMFAAEYGEDFIETGVGKVLQIQ